MNQPRSLFRTLPPLKLSCIGSDCDSDLHCFRESRRIARQPTGTCRYCGANLVDWVRVRRLDLGDSAHTFQELRREWIRHRFWHAELDLKARNHALRKGKIGLRAAAERRIRSSVAVKTPRDGRQTPWKANIIYYAQHATASCCRRCIEYWHGIPSTLTLGDEQIAYFTELCMRYIADRLPDLPDHGRHVPPTRRSQSPP